MDDFDALKLPSISKVSGGLGLLLGLFESILAAQTLTVLRPIWRFPLFAVMLGLGLTIGYAGYRVTRGSGKAALMATLLAALNLLVTSVWFVFAISQGLLSPLTLLVLLLSIATIVFSGIALPELRRVDAARERLRAEGLDTGL
jgi:hypothetical protein